MKKVLMVLLIMFSCSWALGSSQYPRVYNVTLTSADTEYSQTLSPTIQKMTVQCRTSFDVRYAYLTGKVATPTAPYATIKSGATYWEDSVSTRPQANGTVLYLASSEAGVVVEITIWR